MDVDFSLLLVVLSALCGAVVLLDALVLRRLRRAPAKEGGEAERSREPAAVEYARSFLPVLLFVLALRSFLFEPFQIPTGSMIPTLEVGDFVLVNKFAYGLRLPVVGAKILDVGEPRRGDVMVFVPPIENKPYIKRVIGVPGDTVRYEDKILRINGEAVAREYLDRVSIETGGGAMPGTAYTETTGGVRHTAQYIDRVRRRRDRTSWVIPGGHYFMMGDNRDNSLDSREWGMVPERNIVGKAVAVWMHKEPGLRLPTFSRNKLID